MSIDIRNEIVDSIFKEIVGPCPNPEYLDEETGEELLLLRVHGSPKARYGAGMLYPQQSSITEQEDLADRANDEDFEILNSRLDEISNSKRTDAIIENGCNDEEPVGLANQYKPSAMGVTIRLKANENNDHLKIKVKSAFYEKGHNKKVKKHRNKEGRVENSTFKNKIDPVLSDYWIRRPLFIDLVELKINELFKGSNRIFEKILVTTPKGKNWLSLKIFNRTTNEDTKEGFFTLTFTIVNEIKSSTDDKTNSKFILFQNELNISVTNPVLIQPYRERNKSNDTIEEKELTLLYRNKRIFGIGHGVSAQWNAEKVEDRESVLTITTSAMPIYDLPQVAPTAHVELSMYELSDKGDWSKAKKSLHKMVSNYSDWIDEMEAKVSGLKGISKEAAEQNINKCKDSLKRIRKGVDVLSSENDSSDIVKCFRWMNRAMIWQQQRSKTRLRKWLRTGVKKNSKLILEGIDGSKNQKFPTLKEFYDDSNKNGRWRPFQIAFILMNLESIINSDSEERKIVDLIWFPTGGGKTEAYLGLAAFNIFYRRIKGLKGYDWNFFGGTTVIMRYTLRLLTTQQYERAASLICACDQIRKEGFDLGEEKITIGLWVGGTSTPNKNKDALIQLKNLEKDHKAEYNFVVMKCPCCGGQIGKIDGSNKYTKPLTKGISKEDGTNGDFRFDCENPNCEYYSYSLPLQVVDELIYKNPPTLLLGTVDKFAMVPWKPEAGNLFGFRKRKDDTYERIKPPELIIQDELHLIAGPLGTMVGLYETLIQTLCNNYLRPQPPFLPEKESKFFAPKIIASSATISRAYEQVKSLYGIKKRAQLNIFPAQGLDFGNTWFSEEKSLNEITEDGKQKFPGRKYVGILAPGYPSAQTAIVRAYSSVLQRVKELSNDHEKGINYYWTLLGYFNSIRELGGASSLVYGDIRERLGQIHNRELIVQNKKRYINKIQELTSRISSAQIPQILKFLEKSYSVTENKALDICLATNMVATGVDISRLGLMFIHGQPKTTAEYIQASSRVGRRLPQGAGLIFTLYSSTKPRDKSQFEQFQSYHSRIYSNVEPTSVTPFSINAREKGLHAVLIGLIRHFSSGRLKEAPFVEKEFDELVFKIKNIILERCHIIDPAEFENTKLQLKNILEFWKINEPQRYGDAGNYGILNHGYNPLMYASSSEVPDETIRKKRSISTPTSMRGIDTESVIKVY